MFLKLFSLAGAFLYFIVNTSITNTANLAAGYKINGRDKPGTKKNKPFTVKSIESTKHWQYTVLKDTMTVTVIKYYKAHSYCGSATVKAMAICIDSKGDSLRIIELCPGPKEYETGDLLDFHPYSHITQNKKTYEKYKMSDEYIDQYRFNSVSKTTFARLSKHITL